MASTGTEFDGLADLPRSAQPSFGDRFVRSLQETPRWRTWALFACIAGLGHGSERYFASNQYTYLLHAFRSAIPTSLQHDWLASTADPTPVFSAVAAALMSLGVRLGPYLAHLGLVALGYTALAGIVTTLFPRLCTVAGMTFVFGALSTLNAVPGLRHVFLDGAAEQTLFGGYLQPSGAGILLLVALFFAARGRALPATVSAGLAAILHPTYSFSVAIVGGTLALGECSDGRRREAALSGAVTCLCVLIAAWQISCLTRGVSAQVTEQAHAILAIERIPHHALVEVWAAKRPWSVALQLSVTCAALWVVGLQHRRLAHVLAVSLLTAVSVTLLAALTRDLRLALAFPWRASVWLVPTSTALLLAALGDRWLVAPDRRRALTFGAGAVLLIGGFTHGFVQRIHAWNEPPPEAALVRALEAYTLPSDVLIAPVDLEWTRLEAERPVIADMKSHPFRPDEVVEWWSRIQLLEAVYDASRSPTRRRAALVRLLKLSPRPSRWLLPSTDPLLPTLNERVVWRDARWTLLDVSHAHPAQ